MTTQSSFEADIVEFESGEGVYAEMDLREKETSVDGVEEALDYPGRLIPANGRYLPANFDVTVVASAEPRGVERTVGPAESVAEFEAEAFETGVDNPLFALRDRGDGSVAGQLWIRVDRLPGKIDGVGDHCYVTIRMEYRHERTLDVLSERVENPEEVVEQRRKATREMFEEWGEEYL